VKFDNFIDKILSEDILQGGLSDNHTPKDIARKHNVSIDDIRFQIAKGLKVEYEHTNDKKIAMEIVLDHLYEISDYYDRLEEMEKDAKVKEEMVSGDVVGGSGYGDGIAPQDNIDYARGDARVPKSIFGNIEDYENGKKKKKKKKKKTIHIQRRNQIGM
jgi:hypothetical protein